MQESLAIDGPAGAGKSTVARMVAEALDCLYIDTGAMYRALTLKAISCNMLMYDNSEVLTELAYKTDIKLKPGTCASSSRVFCDGEDVTARIKSPQVSRYVSVVAGVSGVRWRMVELQREMAAGERVVMDGRDIGSFVLPWAKYKFFLTASLEVRAKRRFEELVGQGLAVSLEQVKCEIKARDRQDTERELAPLVQPPDAEVIDTSDLSPHEVVRKIVEHFKGNNNVL